MRRLKLVLSICLFLFGVVPALHAQGKTAVQILGKDKGTVSSIKASGHTLLDAQATAKKLGGTVEFFSASKQLKIAFPGMYAIVSASLREAIINTSTVALPAETIVSGGKIYVPVEFFLLPQIQKALDRQIAFQNNTLVVEKHFTVAFEQLDRQTDFDGLQIWTKAKTAPTLEQTNKHTLKAMFPNAVLKRDISQRPKDTFIRSFSLSQSGKNVVVEVVLGTQGKVWKMIPTSAGQMLRISAKEIADPPAKTQKPAEQKAPALQSSVVAEELPAPSVTAEGEEDTDAEELDLSAQPEDTPILSADEEAAASVPVLSAVPPPTISAAPAPIITAKGKIHIVVDPGHGGQDPGAVRRGSAREKDLNLAVSKHLYNYLKKQGVDVTLTRSDDTFVTLAGRSKKANDLKADLFVSIHTNATKKSDANGFEVYFRSDKATDKEAADIAAFENESLQYEEAHYSFVDKLLQSLAKNEYMNESSKLAGHVRNYVYKEPGIGIAVRQNNSIKQANFYVLRGVQSPAILVEMGFISSPKDKARLNNKSAQKKMGEGIGKGIMSYLKAEGKVK
ncbi:MAG: N-acetylmuramoyl-L-alanine amidase [Elusimicrobiaceae bacterium]|nr:N-acetylmuramoyl-L-alanine amidase [Elusimicrobiaceae bacterium]